MADAFLQPAAAHIKMRPRLSNADGPIVTTEHAACLVVAAQAFVGLNTGIRLCEDQVLLAADTTVSAFLRTDIDLVKCLADLADCHRQAGGVCCRCCAPAELQSCCHGSLRVDAMSGMPWALSTAPYGGVGSALTTQ